MATTLATLTQMAGIDAETKRIAWPNGTTVTLPRYPVQDNGYRLLPYACGTRSV